MANSDAAEAKTVRPQDVRRPGTRAVAATRANAPFVPGRREFFHYRDLKVEEASAGRMRAQIMSAVKTLARPTGWHYHICESQFAYVLKGWADLELEDGARMRLSAGESLYIPGGFKHNETAISDDFEILEVCVPADFGTVACDPPEGF